MIRELLLVNRNQWPSDPPALPAIRLGEPLPVKPIAWGPTDGLSHRGYLLTMTSEEYQELRTHPGIDGVSLHHAGTVSEPVALSQVLAAMGLESEGDDNG